MIIYQTGISVICVISVISGLSQPEDVPQFVFAAPLFVLPGWLLTDGAPHLQVLQEVPHADKLPPGAQHAGREGGREKGDVDTPRVGSRLTGRGCLDSSVVTTLTEYC